MRMMSFTLAQILGAIILIAIILPWFLVPVVSICFVYYISGMGAAFGSRGADSTDPKFHSAFLSLVRSRVEGKLRRSKRALIAC